MTRSAGKRAPLSATTTGHGRSAPSPERFGDFGEGGFNLLVDDMVRLTRIAKEENPEKPFILLGHSMGSFAATIYSRSQ
jgi:alpha-beta hydrolase superfamily lysophospholipase